MANETIRIAIEAHGDRIVQSKLRGIGSSAHGAETSVNRLKIALATIASSVVLRSLIHIADSYRFIQNRIRVVTDSTEELTVVTEELFQASRRSRSAFQITAEIYSRLAIAATDLGTSQAEVIRITEDLNKIILISGTRVKEATNALIQLSQGIASNTLRGDELRAVLEQLPLLLRFIAREMGISFGQAREFAAQGKITADVIFAAVKNARTEIADRFGKVLPTIAQAWEVFKNAVTEWVGEADLAIGISTRLSNALLFLADNLDVVARAFTALGVTVATLTTAKAILAILGAARALVVFLVVNPFTAIFRGLALGLGLLVGFGDKVKIASDRLATFQDFAISSFQTLAQKVRELHDALETIRVDLGFLPQIMPTRDVELNFVTITRAATRMFDNILQASSGFVSAFKVLWDEIPNFVVRSMKNAFRNALVETVSGLNSFATVFNLFTKTDFFPKLSVDLEEEGGKTGLKIGLAVVKGFTDGVKDMGTPATDLFDEILVKAEKRAADRAKRLVEEQARLDAARKALENAGKRTVTGEEDERLAKLRQILAALKEENRLLKLNNAEREVERQLSDIDAKTEGLLGQLPLYFELIKSLLQQNQALERQNALLDELSGKQHVEQQIADLEALRARYSEAEFSVESYTAAMRQLRALLLSFDNSLFGGVKAGLASLVAELDRFGETVAGVVRTSFDRAADTIVEFARTGKLELRSLASSIVEEFLRLATIRLFAYGASLIPGFAHGGDFRVAGSGGTDSQLVAFRATPGEQVSVRTPGQQGREAVPAPVVPNITLVNVTDPDEIPSAMAGPSGERVILNVINRNPNVIRRILAGGA